MQRTQLPPQRGRCRVAAGGAKSPAAESIPDMQKKLEIVLDAERILCQRLITHDVNLSPRMALFFKDVVCFVPALPNDFGRYHFSAECEHASAQARPRDASNPSCRLLVGYTPPTPPKGRYFRNRGHHRCPRDRGTRHTKYVSTAIEVLYLHPIRRARRTHTARAPKGRYFRNRRHQRSPRDRGPDHSVRKRGHRGAVPPSAPTRPEVRTPPAPRRGAISVTVGTLGAHGTGWRSTPSTSTCHQMTSHIKNAKRIKGGPGSVMRTRFAHGYHRWRDGLHPRRRREGGTDRYAEGLNWIDARWAQKKSHATAWDYPFSLMSAPSI